MENQYQPLASGEVLSVKEAVQFLIGHGTFRSGEFLEEFKRQLLEYNIGGLTEDKEAWFTEQGIECEVLRFGSSGWQKGFVRLNLEFCPVEEATASKVQSTQQPQPQPATAAPSPEEDAMLDLETLSSSEEDLNLDDDLFGESTGEFDLAEEDLDLGEDFTEEPNAAADEDLDLDLGEEDLDLGEDFTEEPNAAADEDLDLELGEELEDPFGATPESSDGEDLNLESFGEDSNDNQELEDALAFQEDDLSRENEEKSEALDLDLGLSKEDQDDDLMDLEELEADEDFSFEDFGVGEGESEDMWQDQKS